MSLIEERENLEALVNYVIDGHYAGDKFDKELSEAIDGIVRAAIEEYKDYESHQRTFRK